MIASLTGALKQKSPGGLIVEVGGVGYRVQVSTQTLARLPVVGGTVTLLIHTAVREDDISLFGFLEEQEQKLFQRLLSVSGIGPKLALVILSGIPPRDLIDALSREDLVRLTAIPGIGRKTAERMIVDLKDKLVDLIGLAAPFARSADGWSRSSGRIFEEALSALTNLGYSRSAAEKTLARLAIKADAAIGTVVKQALRLLSETA